MNKKLFHYQKNKTGYEKQHWCPAMVMFFKSMIKRIRSYTKSQDNHPHFKTSMMNNVYSKQRQTT